MKSGDMDPNSVSINYLRTLGKLLAKWWEWNAFYIL